MKSLRRNCKNKSDIFCYICGTYTNSKQRTDITEKVKQVYFDYFQMQLGDQDKDWAPHKICTTCFARLICGRSQKRKEINLKIQKLFKQKQIDCSGVFLE